MTIKEIKSIEITLKEGYVIRTDFNGYKDEAGYDLMLSNDNALRVARTLTRLANIFWEAGPKGEIYADFHGFSLREVKMAIDYDLDKEK